MLQLSRELSTIITTASQFKTKLDPFTTNELFLKWKTLQHNSIDNINQYINIGIEIIKLQNKYDRNIKKSYSALNAAVKINYLGFDNNTCVNYLSLARQTHLNNAIILQSIYDQIKVDQEISLNCLKYCADLQCNNMDLISSLIDNLHPQITEEQFNQYLFCLFVLFPPEQSTLLINLIRNKKVKNLNSQNFLLLSTLFQSKNLEIPKSWEIVHYEFPKAEIKQSQLQKEVQLLLNTVNVQYEQEKVIDDLYQIDFYLPRENQVLEVNGPQHYVYDIEQNNPQIFTGKHYFKQMCLTSLGYDVRNLCFLEFYKARGVTAKLQYLKGILD